MHEDWEGLVGDGLRPASHGTNGMWMSVPLGVPTCAMQMSVVHPATSFSKSSDKIRKNIMQCCWISGGKPCGLDCNMTECDKDYMFVVIACINIKCNVWQFNHCAKYAWTAWGECHSCRDWQGLYQLVVSNRDLCLQECDHHFECLH